MSVDMDRIQKYKLFVATPMYGGMCNARFYNSMMKLQNLFYQLGIMMGFSQVSNQSIVSFGRNELVDMFLKTDFTHLLFVDADIGFDPEDIVRLLHFDKDIIGIPCSHKVIEWSVIKEAILKNPDINIDDIPKYAGRPNYYTENDIKVYLPTEIERIGTGIMMIKRCVFEKMIKHYPQIKCKNKRGETHYSFFNEMIDNKYDTLLKSKDPTDCFYSEDYTFCKMWKKLNGSIWMCPWMKSSHTGDYEYKLDIPALSELYDKK